MKKPLKTKTTLTPTSGDTTFIEVVTVPVVMVVEESSGQEQEGENMNRWWCRSRRRGKIGCEGLSNQSQI